MVRDKTYEGKIYCYAVPPLPADFPLPPLPPIPIARLREIALTHTSFHGSHRETHDLDTARYSEIKDYEKLEFLGDRILSLCVDMMVHEVFPGMRQGVASMLHDQMVRNELLAEISDRYGLPNRLRVSHDARYATRVRAKARASVFESYIAGVFYAHLEGSDRVVEDSNQVAGIMTRDEASTAVKVEDISETKPVPAQPSTNTRDPPPETKEDPAQETNTSTNVPTSPQPTTNEDAIAQPPHDAIPPAPPCQASTSRTRTYGEALDYTYGWLRPLFRPVLDHALKAKQEYQKKLEADKKAADALPEQNKVIEEELLARGAASALNQYCGETFDRMPDYTCERRGEHEWQATCTVTTLTGEKFEGRGVKRTKRQARAIASYQVGLQMKLFQ